MTKRTDLTLKIRKSDPVFKRMLRSNEAFWNSGHIGTHLDIMGDVDIPLDYMRSRGKLIDVSGIKNREISLEDLKDVVIEKNDFILFYTDFMKEYAYGEPGYFSKHPQISSELISELIKKKVRFIGIDAAGLRRGKEHQETDQRCADQGIYIIENLVNLEKLCDTKKFNIICLWLHREGMTGIPCRVIAEEDTCIDGKNT